MLRWYVAIVWPGLDVACEFTCAETISANVLKDVRSHCYCASLVRTLFIRHAHACHVFQARAPSQNSAKYRADDLCVNLVRENFCWMLGDPHFFFGRSFPFMILSIILKNKKNMFVGSFNYFSCTIQIGLKWYMDTGVRDLEVAFFRLILHDVMTYVAEIYQIGLYKRVKHTYLRYDSTP